MKKLFLILVFASCGVISKDASFIGEWHLCKESQLSKEFKGKDFVVFNITKGDKFYNVGMKFENEKSESCAYQISPDKRFIFAIDNPSSVIVLNDNNTLTITGLGQFEKK